MSPQEINKRILKRIKDAGFTLDQIALMIDEDPKELRIVLMKPEAQLVYRIIEAIEKNNNIEPY